MSKLIKEITFNILESTEYDLKDPVVEKKRKRKRLDDYDYNDDFIETFEGESELVELDCSLKNFFVFQGPLPFSTKKVVNFFKNKPNLLLEKDDEIQLLEDSFFNVRKKRKASSTKIPEYEENNVNKINKKERKKRSTNKEYLYRDPIITYLYGKFSKLHNNYNNLESKEKIWCVLSNYILYMGNEEVYNENIKIYEKNIIKNENTIKNTSPSIDTTLYSYISLFFTDEEINNFVADIIEKIDNALVSITVLLGKESMYSQNPRKFLGFQEPTFLKDSIVYFTNYVVKHYASDTSHDILYYYQEAKKSLMEVFLECSNKVKTLYFINQHYKKLIDKEKYDL